MIPIVTACLMLGCLDIDPPPRPDKMPQAIHRQIAKQFPKKEEPKACYVEGIFHVQCPKREWQN